MEVQNPEDLINRIVIAATDIRGGELRLYIRVTDSVAASGKIACAMEDVTSNKKKIVFLDVALCRSWVNRRFGGTYRLHLHGR
jgi:hypothetical protein